MQAVLVPPPRSLAPFELASLLGLTLLELAASRLLGIRPYNTSSMQALALLVLLQSWYAGAVRILLRGVGPGPDLTEWEGRPFWPDALFGPGPQDHEDVYEAEVAQEAPGPPEPGGAYKRVAAALLRYEIFPPTLVVGVVRQTPLQVGDTVGICYHGPLGIDLFFAARVIGRLQERDAAGRWQCGFTYRTLVGHPELGEETFAVTKDEKTGSVRVSLRSWSRPGTVLARAGAMVVRRLQVHASLAALRHLEGIARGDPAPTPSPR